jgi:acyl-CoA synthetase (AMP-forming)/AMP-acid ligase II
VADAELGLWELVEARAAATPAKVLIVDEDGGTTTAAEYRDAAERAAAGLQALGVGPDTPVSWMLPTWPEAAVLAGALSRLGAVQNPMIPILGAREMRFIAKQTGARLLIVPSKWRDRDYEGEAREVAADQPGLDVLVADRKLPEGDRATLPPPPPSSKPDDAPIRWVFYTSGTTADPKGTRHTDHTVKAAAVGMNIALELGPDDRTALVFPLTHIGGIVWVYSLMMTGCLGVFAESFVPKTTIPVLQRERVTLAGAGTTFHMAYLAAQREQPETPLLPDVRAFPGGAAPKPPQLHYEIKQEMGGVGIVSGWGLTESPILTMNTVRDTDEQLAETEGAPVPGVTLRVVKVDGGEAGVGEEGELRAKGQQILKGFVDSSLDADAFDDDGWLRTGDLGTIDAAGHVRITGRLKDVIIRKGESISAKEVEDLLFAHPKIGDAAVIGLPDPKAGERVCAVVAPAGSGDPPTLAEVFEFLKSEGLTVQKIPEQLEVIDVLPRNASGKVLKHELRAKYGD